MEIRKVHADIKKQNLKNEIMAHVDDILRAAENMGSLDFMTIELNVHDGRLDSKCILKNRKKVY